MYKLKYRTKPTWRESQIPYRDKKMRLICVALQPTSVLLRLKKTRQIMEVPIGRLFQYAADLNAKQKLQEKKDRRKRKDYEVRRGVLGLT